MRNWWRALVILVFLVVFFVIQEGFWTLGSTDTFPPPKRHPIIVNNDVITRTPHPTASLAPHRNDQHLYKPQTTPSTKPNRETLQEHQPSQHTPVNIDTNHSKTAIVTIAVGEKARYFARYLIVSFLRNSNFHGPLYLITDDPSYYDDLTKERQLHPESEIRFVAVNYNEGGGGTVAHLELPIIPDDTIVKENKYGIIVWVRYSDYKRGRLQIKWLKTKLFELIPPEYEHLIFMDSDILIGKDMNKFLAHSLRLLAAPNCLTLFTDIGHTGSPYHTGVVMFHRERSAELIRVWGHNIMNGTYGSDQRAIEAAVIELGLEDKVGMLSVDLNDGFFGFIKGEWIEEKRPFTFIHCTFFRLTTGAERFGFTNKTAKRYFEETIHTPWEPWTGITIPIIPRYAEPIAGGLTRKDRNRIAIHE